jgi:hypothetical protein
MSYEIIKPMTQYLGKHGLSRIYLCINPIFITNKRYEAVFSSICRKTGSKYGKRNLYPVLIRRLGITRELDSIATNKK